MIGSCDALAAIIRAWWLMKLPFPVTRLSTRYHHRIEGTLIVDLANSHARVVLRSERGRASNDSLHRESPGLPQSCPAKDLQRSNASSAALG